jgi:NMD protein affecting ribosome stability and mRNA decay
MAVTWNRTYTCSDCGKKISYEGTCPDCLIDNQPVPEKLLKDIKKGKGK